MFDMIINDSRKKWQNKSVNYDKTCGVSLPYSRLQDCNVPKHYLRICRTCWVIDSIDRFFRLLQNLQKVGC